MTQLSDDCFANDGRLMPLAEALVILDERLVTVAPVETVALAAACGRILAAAVVASEDVPPHDNSAVDGFAVYFDDLSPDNPTELPVTGRIAAGHPLGRPARRGEAVRVFTGAVMPPGASGPGPDTVLMQEDCGLDGEGVRIPPGVARGANRRSAGEDIAQGTLVLDAGRRLRPEDVGLLASLGQSEVTVHAALRVALFSTGDELGDIGRPRDPGTIFDSNRYTLAALLAGLGCRVTDLGIVADDHDTLASALRDAAAGHDLLITSGGVSVGEEDHVRPVVEALGGLTLWRLAIKPGRPVALGHVDDNGRAVSFVGLPGNPAAVIVTFLRFARPLILKLSGAVATAPTLFSVRAGFSHDKKPGRREFVRCRLIAGEAGGMVAVKAGRQGAGILSTVSAADGLVELPEEMTYVENGAAVDFLPFNEVR
ncbi:MAG: gephyrin-like molybdotransferase Glp [Alphaproteobacteria bacterium]